MIRNDCRSRKILKISMERLCAVTLINVDLIKQNLKRDYVFPSLNEYSMKFFQ